jgi:hypothetical protein
MRGELCPFDRGSDSDPVVLFYMKLSTRSLVSVVEVLVKGQLAFLEKFHVISQLTL